MRYAQKPIGVEAKVYEPGDETGFAMIDFDNNIVSTKREITGQHRHPYIETPAGRLLIQEGDFIIIEDDGTKRVIDRRTFKARYVAMDDKEEIGQLFDVPMARALLSECVQRGAQQARAEGAMAKSPYPDGAMRDLAWQLGFSRELAVVEAARHLQFIEQVASGISNYDDARTYHEQFTAQQKRTV